MTPKSLLRLPQATNRIEHLADTRFHPVLAEPRVDEEQVTRLVLCTGKIYYDLVGPPRRARTTRAWRSAASSCCTRSPRGRSVELIARYPNLERGRVGAGGAAQHGRPRAHVPAPDADPARATSTSATSAGPSARAGRGLPGRPHRRAEPHHRARRSTVDQPVSQYPRKMPGER